MIGSSVVLQLNFCAKNPPLRQGKTLQASIKTIPNQGKQFTKMTDNG